MAAGLLSRKPRLAAEPGPVEPLRRDVGEGLHNGTEAFLFGPAGANSGLADSVRRHADALSGLAKLLSDLNAVTARAARSAPILIDAPLPQMAFATRWAAFDPAVFDVAHVQAGAGDRPLAAAKFDDADLFDAPPPARAPVRSLMLRPEVVEGVRF